MLLANNKLVGGWPLVKNSGHVYNFQSKNIHTEIEDLKIFSASKHDQVKALYRIHSNAGSFVLETNQLESIASSK